MAEIYFENIDNVIISHLNRAQKSLKIAVAWITDANLLAAINSCLGRDIEVTIVFYDDNINSKDRFENLFRRGAKIYYTKKMMHNKFCIIDDEITINGSFNWTKAAKKNHENIQVNHSVSISNQFLIEFKKIISQAQNISKHFADNENDFLLFVEKIGYPTSYPVFFKQVLDTGLKSVFNQIKDTNIKYVYIYCENKNAYLEYQRRIYNYFHTLKKHTFSDRLLESTYNYSRWNEQFTENGSIINIERTERDSFIIVDIITEVNKQFKLLGSDYNLEENFFSVEQFVYLKESNFFLLGIEYHPFKKIESINETGELNSILKLKLTKPYTDVTFESFGLLKDVSIYFERNELLVEENSFVTFGIGSYAAFKAYPYKKLTYIKFPKIEINEEKTEEEYKKKYDSFNAEYLNFVRELEKEAERKHAEKYLKDKELSEKQCYVATMVYGDVDHCKVQLLRSYRDNYLRKNIFGSLFIKFYYATAPLLIKYFNNKHFIAFSKYIIELLIKRIKNHP